MNGPQDNIGATNFASLSVGGDARHNLLCSESGMRQPRRTQELSQSENSDRRSERWGGLMVAAQNGERRVYEKLLRELDAWLRRYYTRRLPRPAAEDARQDALLAIHVNRYSYVPSGSFAAWVAAIARHKWIDRIRDASRVAASSLHDNIPVEDHGRAAISAISVDRLLSHLNPAQANVIRLVKLQGLSIEDASGVTGQSAALVKVNVHRGLKKLSALVARDAVASATCGRSPALQPREPYRERRQMRPARCLHGAGHRRVLSDSGSGLSDGAPGASERWARAIGVKAQSTRRELDAVP
jgi:RNA polymerase sigma-70 factor (ECF subfamily)